MEGKAKPWRESRYRCEERKQILGESREKFLQEENEREQERLRLTSKNNLKIAHPENLLLFPGNRQTVSNWPQSFEFLTNYNTPAHT